jgi:hypothetical protein
MEPEGLSWTPTIVPYPESLLILFLKIPSNIILFLHLDPQSGMWDFATQVLHKFLISSWILYGCIINRPCEDYIKILTQTWQSSAM